MISKALLTLALLAAGRTGARGAEAAPEADLPSERDVWVGARGAARAEGKTTVPEDLTVPAEAVKENHAPAPGASSSNDSSGSGAAARWVGLGLVIAALGFGAAWLQRKKIQLPSRRIRVVESVPVGPKRSMMLVEVEGQQLLVGSSEAGLQVLSVRPLGEAEPLAEAEPVADRLDAEEFQELLEGQLEADELRRKMGTRS